MATYCSTESSRRQFGKLSTKAKSKRNTECGIWEAKAEKLEIDCGVWRANKHAIIRGLTSRGQKCNFGATLKPPATTKMVQYGLLNMSANKEDKLPLC